jgi:hypothetical protein
MADPITIGGLVAAALAAGAVEAGKGVLGAAAKDAYEALKGAAHRLIGGAVDELEKKPESNSRAGVVAEEVDEAPGAVQAELRQLAEALREALTAEGKGATIDNRITVIATGGSVAAGRDVNIGAMPPRDPKG